MKSIIESALSKSILTTENTPKGEADKELEHVLQSLQTRIKVIGCGGGGSNSIKRMMDENIENAEFIALNTDAHHLFYTKANKKILIGKKRTRGLGAGSFPQLGEDAAIENIKEIQEVVKGDMVFITTGLGGGTGTGSAPIVAEAARNAGALTIAVVTLPFLAEGKVRRANAEAGLERLYKAADTVIVVPNDKLLEIVPNMPIQSAFKVADEVLMRAVKGITELITKVGLVNLDFSDVRTVMQNGGVAVIGLGEAEGENKATESVQRALKSPLLDMDISGATSALVNVTGGLDMTISDAELVIHELHGKIDPNARIIWGACVDPEFDNTIRTMLIVTGVNSSQIYGQGHAVAKDITVKYGIDFVK